MKVCIDISAKKPHRMVYVGSVVTPGSLIDLMFSTLALNVRDLYSIHDLGTICPTFIPPPIALAAVIMILYRLHPVWLLNLPRY